MFRLCGTLLLCLLLCGCQDSPHQSGATTDKPVSESVVANSPKTLPSDQTASGPAGSGSSSKSEEPEDREHRLTKDEAPAPSARPSGGGARRSKGYAYSASREEYLKRTEEVRRKRLAELEEEQAELRRKREEAEQGGGARTGGKPDVKQQRRAGGTVVYQGAADSMPDEILQMPDKIIIMNGSSVEVKTRRKAP